MSITDISDRKRIGLNGTQLKLIGIVLMVFDHIHQMFPNQAPIWFTYLGRPVAPIFIFLCAEGFHYTHNRKKYMGTLLIGSIFMTLCSSIIQRIFSSDIVLINNIFSTLFMCTIYMLAVDFIREGISQKKPKKFLIATAIIFIPILISIVSSLLISSYTLSSAALYTIMIIPNPLLVEGGPLFIVLGLFFYGFRKYRWVQIVALVGISVIMFLLGDTIQSLMIFAAIFIYLYNGERGKGYKYFFYIFYPVHIYFLYILAYFLNK